MLVWVPDPVWKTTRGKWRSSLPAMTSSAAFAMFVPMDSSSLPVCTLYKAQHFLTVAMALTMASGILDSGPPMGKFSNERCVCAPHNVAAGTCNSPIESLSVRAGRCAAQSSVVGVGAEAIMMLLCYYGVSGWVDQVSGQLSRVSRSSLPGRSSLLYLILAITVLAAKFIDSPVFDEWMASIQKQQLRPRDPY